MNPTRYLDPAVLRRLDRMELRARFIVEGFITGLHRSPYHGFSVEFAEHRPYNAGDELRHVDWKVYAKTDRHYVKRYEEETNLRGWVVLDTSASMRYRGSAAVTKLEYGAYLAAALCHLLVRQRDAAGLALFSGGLDRLIPPKATGGHLRLLMRELDALDADAVPDKAGEAPETAAADALHALAERVGRRALVTVISDLFENQRDPEALLKALRHLRHRGHEVLVFHVLDRATEARLDLPDRPVRLRDAETGETRVVEPAQLRRAYAGAVDAFTRDFQRRAREHGIDFVALDTARPYGDALLAYLNKRRRLY